jgi:hypothetical protein
MACVLPAACARAVQVTSGPSPTYPIEVRNVTGEEVIVSYDDGTGPRVLGNVVDGRTERFVIAARERLEVSVTARSIAGSRSWGPFHVSLTAGEAQRVTIR